MHCLAEPLGGQRLPQPQILGLVQNQGTQSGKLQPNTHVINETGYLLIISASRLSPRCQVGEIGEYRLLAAGLVPPAVLVLPGHIGGAGQDVVGLLFL